MNRYLLVLATIVLASCGLSNRPQISAKESAAIMGGTDVAESSTLASGIVGIYDLENNAICTGSLIAEGYVLTAAHCVWGIKPSKIRLIFGVDMDGLLNAREQDIVQTYTRSVSDYRVHSSYDPDTQEDNEFDWGDIALIKFRGTLPEGYKPVQLLPDDSILKRGLTVTVAGYGVSEVETEPVDARKVKNLDEALEYGEVICDDDLRNCLKVEMSGDGLLRQTKAPIAAVQETEVRLDESKGHGTCAGDSGGPAYVEQNGKMYLFGVTSRGSALCDNTGVYTNAVYYKDWITQTMPKLR
ncbi:serine protease [Bdellovibrio bacteriovorus]|uniref:S1 family peptidase n=1 Tax=Bdellovibrio bacteriovorus TaxID=959 RepID=UPI0021D3CFF1|nr:serine protease [Bdellovibrio bacteriovorus]UXR65979.1 serine protease [Bdellovibrio bacteriovorus]